MRLLLVNKLKPFALGPTGDAALKFLVAFFISRWNLPAELDRQNFEL